MNCYTHKIAKLLKIDLESAKKVQGRMSIMGIRWNSATTREINKTAREAYAEIKHKL